MATKNTSKSESEDKTREVIDTLEGIRKDKNLVIYLACSY